MHQIMGTREKESNRAQYTAMLWAMTIVALVVLPVPAWLLDMMLTVSISAGMLLLLVSMDAKSPLRFSSYPSLLLLVTLFRLGLNVASTRLILLHGSAGQVISSFGNFVVGGEVLVGLVIFMVITVVQFLVVAKGAERVAEVAARFTLDAMPGKQLAIDSELRAGHITPEEARRRREILEKESRFYGAMDGAMKFVKGDAIAALVIAAVNIAGGIAMGLLRMDMSLGEALSTYTVLAVGDGLVSQIPSLLSALSAGVLVTRVAGQDSPSMGHTILQELISSWRPFMVASLILGTAALVPGMPGPAFGGGAVALALAGWWVRSREVHRHGAVKDKSSGGGAQGTSTDEQSLSPVSDISIVVGTDAAHLLTGAGSEIMERDLPATVTLVSQRLGLPSSLLEPTVVVSDALERESFQITVKGITVSSGFVSRDARTTGGPPAMADALESALMRHAGDLISPDTIKNILDFLSHSSPYLVTEAYRRLDLLKVTRVCRRLVEEGISLAYMDRILETLILMDGDEFTLAEEVRVSLGPYFTSGMARQGRLSCVVVSGRVEDEIAVSVSEGAAGPSLRMDPEVAELIAGSAAEVMRQYPGSVLLASRDVRRYLWKILSHEIPGITVISPEEIAPALEIIPVAQLEI